MLYAKLQKYGFKAIRDVPARGEPVPHKKFSPGPPLRSRSCLFNIHNNDVPRSNGGQMAVFHCWTSRGPKYHINIKIGEDKLTDRAPGDSS